MTLAKTQALFHGIVTGDAPGDAAGLERAFLGTDELPAAAGPGRVAGTRLRLSDALRVIDLASDGAALWRQVESGGPVVPPAPGPTTVVVWRRGFEVLHCTVSSEEAAALRAARDGEALESICAAFEDSEDPAADAHAAVASRFNEGWIAAVSVDPAA